MKWGREIVSQPAFERFRGKEIEPGEAAQSDADILAGVEREAISGYHPVGTAKMGLDSDPMAVVNKDLQVRGIVGLRVVDASIMPILVTGNTNAPTVMIAEKTADVIRGRAPLARVEV
ncbi:MAG: hypothetical protein HN577_12495 [Rhodospirillaceae bacterium]|nr:hypothetical protein [Rhodospirillaceae bacterium]